MSSAINQGPRYRSPGKASIRAVVCIFSASLTGIAWGRSTFGEFVGTVHDPTGSVVLSCVVKAVNQGTSAARSTLTDAPGGYTLVNMERGDYEISISAPGFDVTKFSSINLMARQTIRQYAHLTLTKQGQTVNVSAATEAPINAEVPNIAETKIGR